MLGTILVKESQKATLEVTVVRLVLENHFGKELLINY